MKELASLFDAFYSRFILRDLFGKIGPGLMVLAACAAFLTSYGAVTDYVPKMNFWAWGAISIMSWLTGFAVQEIGERLRIVRHWPRTPFGNEVDRWYRFVLEFDEVATPAQKQVDERFAVILEACGNGCVALGWAMLLLLANGFVEAHLCGKSIASWLEGGWPVLPILVSGIAALVGLAGMHRRTVTREYEWMKAVMERRREQSGPWC